MSGNSAQTLLDAHVTKANGANDRSRVGATWMALTAFVSILLLLLIFVAQNSKAVKIQYLGTSGTLSFGVAMLLSAVAGSILTILVGSVRIIQLKMRKKT
ncbi:DUF1049 domain-containing protein [Aeromicrobium sp.]|nr:DUF1049 domain-containing protein [Candidatus Saccharibacteria bacterium]